MEFSQQLIDRMKRYFLVRFDQQITDETADEYLGQFAELYASMAVFAACEEPGVAPGTDADVSGSGAGAPAPDLISPHS